MNDERAAGPSPALASLTKFAWLSIAAAVITISLKVTAYLLTGSVGLLSDAAESVVNLVAAIVALIVIKVAQLPADANHHFGHGKAEYFSAGLEGLLIFIAAAAILVAAAQRLISPQPLEKVGLGLTISMVAAAVNLGVGLVLIKQGRRHRSRALEADGHHLMTDVYTSVGVIVGVLAVQLTGWLRLDPIIAILVAVNILWTGWRLVKSSTYGLMDAALSAGDHATIVDILDGFTTDEVHFHALQTRESGRNRFVSMHVLVPGSWNVQRGHDLLEDVEAAIESALPGTEVHTHLEPREDVRAYEDIPPGGWPFASQALEEQPRPDQP